MRSDDALCSVFFGFVGLVVLANYVRWWMG